MYPKRHYNKWTVNELLSLQREYELLEWTVQQIAGKHERTLDAILYRLEDEGIIDNRINARGYIYNLDSLDQEPLVLVKDQSEPNDLNQRMWNLESSVSEMKTIVKEMVNNFMENKRQKKNLKPLRQVKLGFN
jgi:DNA-binding transcriptional regulator PaaX